MEEEKQELPNSMLLGADQFKTLLGMLKSRSEEDKALAFMCINRLSPEINLPLMLLLRLYNQQPADWSTHASIHYMYHRSLDITNVVRTEDVYRYLDRGNKEVNEDLFAEYILHKIKTDMACMLRNAEITIKIKKKNE